MDFRDVVVDAGGRVYAATREPARGSVSFGDWGNLYYWENGWLPVAYGFADPRGLATDDAGNVYVANFRGEAISVVTRTDPSVVGVMRNVPFPRSLAVWGDRLIVAGYDTIVALPLGQRDGLAQSPTITAITPAGDISGQGSRVTVQTSGHDPIPAHNVLRVGEVIIHEMASFSQEAIQYQLPIQLTPVTVARHLSVPSGEYRFSVGATQFSQGGLRMPAPGEWHFAQWYITDTLGVAQGDWLVWTIAPGTPLGPVVRRSPIPALGCRPGYLAYLPVQRTRPLHLHRHRDQRHQPHPLCGRHPHRPWKSGRQRQHRPGPGRRGDLAKGQRPRDYSAGGSGRDGDAERSGRPQRGDRQQRRQCDG